MKKNIKYLFLTCAIGLCTGSCSEDFLETTPTSSLTEVNYFQTVEELESALFACYSAINSYIWEGWFFSNMVFPLFGLGDVGSDDSESGGGNPTWDIESVFQEISMSRQGPDNFMLWFWWVVNYDLIGKCNLVIDKSEGLSQDPDLNQERIARIVKQAKFFRAFALYNLVTMYGDIPLPLHFLRPDELDLERTNKSIVWEQIEMDLEDASSLPMNSEWEETGRISQGAVYALLGKVYMWQAKDDQTKFGQAVEAYTKIIESGEYGLEADYGDIHRHGSEHGVESIFEFQHALGVDGGDISTIFWIFTMPRDADYGNNGWGFGNPTEDLIQEFEPGDPRIIYTAIFEGDVFEASHIDTGDYVVRNTGSHTGYTSRKSWIPFEERTGEWGGSLDKNYRYCRYAEVLLFCAEALNEIGQPDKAREYVNMVRARARNTSPVDIDRKSYAWDLSFTPPLLPDVTATDPDELRLAIWHEQRVELAMEGHRRWILLRTDRFKDRMEVAKGDKGCTVEEHELLLPIHSDEVENSYGRIPQNPGYN